MFYRFSGLLFFVLLCLATPVLAQDSVTTFEGVYQPFENGHMVWLGNTGDIWVLYSGGTAAHFPESSYASLPDNPITATPESDTYTNPEYLVRPVSGFGRVWGNSPDVREQLGWGLAPEVAYQVTREQVYELNALAFQINDPFGRLIVIQDDDTWRFLPSAVETEINSDAIPTASIPENDTPQPFETVSYQPFENGFMMYFFRTGVIKIYQTDGTISWYSTYEYGDLSPNPIEDTPPANLFSPTLGFGKVWGHFPDVREQLGWATAPEETYLMPMLPAEWDGPVVRTIITLPDGTQIEEFNGRGSYWQLLETD